MAEGSWPELTAKQRRAFDSKFWRLRWAEHGAETHLRVTVSDEIELVGSARHLHGPDGVCTCCPRRAT